MLLHRYRKSSAVALASLLLAGFSAFAQQPADPTRNLTPVTDATLRNPPASDWLMWRRTFDGYGYSPLAQINKNNVKDLQEAWTWSMVPGATETTPIAHDGELCIFNYANQIQALNRVPVDRHCESNRGLPIQLMVEPP